jgi:hypothetical protein
LDAGFLRRLETICPIARVDQAVITLALTVNFRDFEDAIQYSTAVINQLDAIATRNSADFMASTLPILTPRELLQKFSVL